VAALASGLLALLAIAARSDEQLAAYSEAEMKEWAKVIRDANIKAE
jgi:hypothetical protein